MREKIINSTELEFNKAVDNLVSLIFKDRHVISKITIFCFICHTSYLNFENCQLK